MTAHKYIEAFCLLRYETEDGAEVELLWNSRDGVTPPVINSREGAEMRLVGPHEYAPDHTPEVGDRIFVDLTPQRARVLAAQFIEKMLDPNLKPLMGMSGREMLESAYGSREEAVADTANKALADNDGHTPDILVVTHGYIEELLEMRAAGATPEARMKPRRARGRAPSSSERLKAAAEKAAQNWQPTPDSVLNTALEELDGRLPYYDKQANPIGMMEWVRLSQDYSYKCIGYTVMPNGDFVSTTWLGLDHGFSFPEENLPPVIFETMIFHKLDEPERDIAGGEHSHSGREQWRYRTEEAAIRGHERIVALLRAGKSVEDENEDEDEGDALEDTQPGKN